MDQQGKTPSSLIRRDNLPTLKSQGKTSHIPFNQERESFETLNQRTLEASQKMQSYQSRSTSLATPLEKREELSAMKEAVATFQEMRSQKIFIKKRNRVIQNSWRDGILGVEMPGD